MYLSISKRRGDTCENVPLSWQVAQLSSSQQLGSTHRHLQGHRQICFLTCFPARWVSRSQHNFPPIVSKPEDDILQKYKLPALTPNNLWSVDRVFVYTLPTANIGQNCLFALGRRKTFTPSPAHHADLTNNILGECCTSKLNPSDLMMCYCETRTPTREGPCVETRRGKLCLEMCLGSMMMNCLIRTWKQGHVQSSTLTSGKCTTLHLSAATKTLLRLIHTGTTDADQWWQSPNYRMSLPRHSTTHQTLTEHVHLAETRADQRQPS